MLTMEKLKKVYDALWFDESLLYFAAIKSYADVTEEELETALGWLKLMGVIDATVSYSNGHLKVDIKKISTAVNNFFI